MRKYWIDNIRTGCILLLFPFHAAMIFNTFGEQFYVTGTPWLPMTVFTMCVYPWWMSLLFTLAGISTAYSLKKRGPSHYAKERIFKLLVPILSALILLLPIQSWIADVFYNGYDNSLTGYFRHYTVFWTRWTDLSGYDGGFAIGHLWFALFLFIASFISLPITSYVMNREKNGKTARADPDRYPLVFYILPVLLLPLSAIILNFGKSLGEALFCFLAGFFLFRHDAVQEKLEKNRKLLGSIWIVAILFLSILCIRTGGNVPETSQLWPIWTTVYYLVNWFGILAVLAFGKKHLDYTTKISQYLAKASWSFYYFHQTILVCTGYIILKLIPGPVHNQPPAAIIIAFVSITIISFVLTVICYEVVRKIPPVRVLSGIKA